MLLFLPGTASVIIALTDGELQELQLITAQQEVHSNFILRLIPQSAAVKSQGTGLLWKQGKCDLCYDF